MQIVQELCKRPSLNRTGFEMPTIYVPTLGKQSRCVNQIELVSIGKVRHSISDMHFEWGMCVGYEMQMP